MTDELSASLHRHFGFASFRPGQRDAIESILAGQHTLVVMPTGAGKSLVYQLCALERPGVTLVISPLIALMKDQVDGLVRRGVAATYLNSLLTGDEQTEHLRGLAAGKARLVYVAPERLRSVRFLEALRGVTIGLLAVDEAHCISQWGHDFRPDYLQIASARARMDSPVTVALTATATPQVQDDIVSQLGLRDARRIVTGFNRPNLSFEVRYAKDDAAKLGHLLKLMSDLQDGAALVYTGTRRSAEEVAEFVRTVCHRPVEYYHAGLDAETRSRVQESFLAGDLPVVVATNAFGMGIDRSDVRLVVHYDLPGTLDAYYQEAGRAGRDGEPAQAVLLYAPRDRALQEFFIEQEAPAATDLRRLYEALSAQTGEQAWWNRDDVSLATGLPEVKVRIGLAQLEEAGVVEHLGDDGMRMLLRPRAWNDAAVQAIAAEGGNRRLHRQAQLQAMIAYAEADTCRRRILLDHFGDASPAEADACCDNCLALQAATQAPATERDAASLPDADRIALVILDAVRRLQWGVGREILADMLGRSRSKKMKQVGYDQNVYYGRLDAFRISDVADMIDQLLGMDLLKSVGGGNRPVLRLTPRGQAAITGRASIPLRLPRPMRRAAVAHKKLVYERGASVELTTQMLTRGMTPAQIAAERMFSEETIYNHLAQAIGEGSIAVQQVVSEDVSRRVRQAIAQVGNADRLAPLKVILPTSFSYGEIRCVAAAWKREQGQNPARSGPSGPERVQEVVALGNARKPEALPQLIVALADPDGNVRRLAASAIGKIGDREAVAPLMELLQHEAKPQVRQYAVRSLGVLADDKARSLLESIAADQEERDYTRLAARRALQRLSRHASTREEAKEQEAREPDPVAVFLSRSHPRALPGPWREGWALGFHSGFGGADWKRSAVGDLTYRLKYEGDATAVPLLAEQAAALCREHPALAAVDGVVPVPPSQQRELEPVGAVAAALAAALRLPMLKVLAKTRQTAPQKDMHTRAQKRANVAGAFTVTADVRGKRLLVLDDLYDSGATLEEVARVLQAAGASAVYVLTLTRTIHSDG